MSSSSSSEEENEKSSQIMIDDNIDVDILISMVRERRATSVTLEFFRTEI